MTERGDYTDEELYEYTSTIMKNISHYYTTNNFTKDMDINKLIELNVAKKIVNVMPERYVEAEVSVMDVGKKKSVLTTFSSEEGIEFMVMHDEVHGAWISHGEIAKKIIERPISFGISQHGTSGLPSKYDPKELKEDFYFGYNTVRGSRVETLPGGQGLGELADLEYFKRKVIKGLKLPHERVFDAIQPPTSWSYMTNKTSAVPEDSKPTIDFTKISQISTPSGDGLPRYESGIHVGIDLAKFNIQEEEGINLMAKDMASAIDKQILEDMANVAAGVVGKTPEWNVPTFGWQQERTNWDDITWKTRFDYAPSFRNPFGGVITDEISPTWRGMDKPLAMEEISFTEEELDELIDLINDCESEIMKFV